jgi:hypothetical protein
VGFGLRLSYVWVNPKNKRSLPEWHCAAARLAFLIFFTLPIFDSLTGMAQSATVSVTGDRGVGFDPTTMKWNFEPHRPRK